MKKKTHEEYIFELSCKNSNIEVVGCYTGANNNILHRCKICGYEWSPKPSLVLIGSGCPECNRNKMSKTHDQYINELCDKNPNLCVIGKYMGYHTKIVHQCNICGYEWSVAPAEVLRGRGCPRCATHIKLTQEAFVNRMLEIHPTIQVIGEYKGSDYPVKVKCLKDDWIWEPLATNLIHLKRGCPKCNQSHGELQIGMYLKHHKINFIQQYSFIGCRNKKPLPFDFYLPECNICIEYDGRQHFEPVDYFGGQVALDETVKHDVIKNNYCLSNNIKLIRIKYDENIIEILDSYFNNTKLIEEAI